jgi:hypothetical protein
MAAVFHYQLLVLLLLIFIEFIVFCYRFYPKVGADFADTQLVAP